MSEAPYDAKIEFRGFTITFGGSGWRELKQSLREQAALDLNAKLRLEAKLRPKVKEVERRLVREVTRTLGNSGNLPDVTAISADKLEPILRRHYGEVEEVFSKRLRDDMPDGLGITEEESAAVAAALAGFFDQRAPVQARAIALTNRKNAARAVTVAEMERERLAELGEEPLGRRGVALIAGAVLSRSLAARTTSIVMLETQAPAEAAKLAEVNVLMGLEPFTSGGDQPGDSARGQDVLKTWVTQGDSRVREKHLGADSDQVPANEPFVVGSDRLMHPGDTSLGASLDNVINCRCSSIVDPDQVATSRAGR